MTKTGGGNGRISNSERYAKTSQRRKLSLVDRLSVEYSRDAFFHSRTGRGSGRDKVSNLRPGLRDFLPAGEARQWYKTSGVLGSVIDSVADDATRAWIKVTTNRDTDDEETGEKGLNISRLIMNRLDELKAKKAIRKLIRNARIYNEGGFMYLGVLETLPPKSLEEPINGVEKLVFLNVFGPQFGHAQANNVNVTSPLFGRPTMFTLGSGAPGSSDVSQDRVIWLVQNFEEEDNRGISTLQKSLDAIKAQDTALWSANHMAFEMAVKVLKSPDVRTMKRDEIAKALEGMQNQMSTQSALLLRDDESFEKKVIQISGVKELFDFIFENISAATQIPKSKIMGNSQGVITAGQYDIINYYDRVAEFQENEIEPIINRLIELIVQEERGEIKKILGSDVENLDWNFTFNDLWIPDPSEKAKIGLAESQSDQINITMDIITAEEARKKRFPDLEDFEAEAQVEKAVQEVEKENLNFTPPDMVEPEPAKVAPINMDLGV